MDQDKTQTEHLKESIYLIQTLLSIYLPQMDDVTYLSCSSHLVLADRDSLAPQSPLTELLV